MVIWQSKVQIFGQHLILKPQTSFDQLLIMIFKAWLKKSQDAKVSILGQLKKSTVTWPRHNFHMIHQKNSIQSSFWREWHFLQLFFTLHCVICVSDSFIFVFCQSDLCVCFYFIIHSCMSLLIVKNCGK